MKKKLDHLKVKRKQFLSLFEEVKEYKEDAGFLEALLDVFISTNNKKKSEKELLIDRFSALCSSLDKDIDTCQYFIEEANKFIEHPIRVKNNFQKTSKLMSFFIILLSTSLALKVMVFDPAFKKQQEEQMLVRKLQQDSQSFDWALEKAMQASIDGQVALTIDDWTNVESLWEESISVLTGISQEHSKYLEAQHKLQQYSENLTYIKSVKEDLLKKQQLNQELLKNEKEILAKREQKEIDTIFNRIAQEYGFRPKIDTWGCCKTIFIPDSAWYKLSDNETKIIMNYARDTIKAGSIIIGRVKNPSTIYVDSAVACFNERAADICM